MRQMYPATADWIGRKLIDSELEGWNRPQTLPKKPDAAIERLLQEQREMTMYLTMENIGNLGNEDYRNQMIKLTDQLGDAMEGFAQREAKLDSAGPWTTCGPRAVLN